MAKGFTIAEASRFSSLHPNTIRNHVLRGSLPAELASGRYGREYRIPKRAIFALMMSRGIEPKTSE